MSFQDLSKINQEDKKIEFQNFHHLATLVNNRYLQLIILPTEQCNFRCFYCYEDFSIGKMQQETIHAVKELIRKRAEDLEYLCISWFGGEPLLAKDVVIKISSFATSLALDNPRLSYRGDMTTNGYLLDRNTFLELVEVGVLDYQITLDGPKEIHNKTRVRSDKKETFDRIWENLIAIRQTDIPARVKLRVHFDKETISKLDPLIQDLHQEFLSDSRFSVLFHSINRMGGPNDAQINTFSLEERKLALEALNKKLHKSQISNVPEACYASRPNSLVIRADGGLGKCTVALNDSRNMIGKLRNDGTLDLEQDRVHLWLRGLETMESATLQCPLSTLPSL